MDPEQIPLRDLHLPEAVGWWPPAPGWWALAALLAAGLVLLLRRYLKARAYAAARRQALANLGALTAEFDRHGDAVRLCAELSALLRRTMLAYAPRSEVAGLTGEAWLEWLDRDFDAPRFRSETGRKLLELPYRRRDDSLAGMDLIGVVALVRQRLATPVGGRA